MFVSNVLQNHYPFGMIMDGRSFSASEYRFGFNGEEKDSEVKSMNSNSYDFGERMYDPRTGRWMSGDPKEAKYPSYSTYCTFFNNPISIIDPSGEGGVLSEEKDEKSGKTFLKVTSIIYIYSEVVDGEQMKALGAKIEKDINDQWNHPDGMAQGTAYYRGKMVPLVFEVKVVVTSTSAAEELAIKAKEEDDYSANFLLVTNDGTGSRVIPIFPLSQSDGLSFNYGTLDINSVLNAGDSEGPHEFGHLLNYYAKSTDPKLMPTTAGHALKNETTSIMFETGNPNGQKNRRVSKTDLQRIENGNGKSFSSKEMIKNGRKNIGSKPSGVILK
ncbi:MAG: hypothetical protein EYC69_09785 [Bacteroidetes bacterium]|nr:MAG: hypothetical protein EYC69_09785 [Bacteroidota bacterium]